MVLYYVRELYMNFGPYTTVLRLRWQCAIYVCVWRDEMILTNFVSPFKKQLLVLRGYTLLDALPASGKGAMATA